MCEVGQRVVVTRQTNGGEGVVVNGRVVAFVVGGVFTAGGFFGEEVVPLERIIVQTDGGRFVFATTREVHVEEKATGQTVAKSGTNGGEGVCPEHPGQTRPSKKAAGGFYCTASVGSGYCTWSWAPEAARVKGNGR